VGVSKRKGAKVNEGKGMEWNGRKMAGHN